MGGEIFVASRGRNSHVASGKTELSGDVVDGGRDKKKVSL